VRICLVSTTSIGRDPKALATAESLRLAGHEVVGVAGDDDDTPWVQTPRSGRVRKPGRTPTGELLVDLAIRQEADIYQPLHPRSVEVAENAAAAIVDATVLSQPDWPAPAIRNLIRLAPADPGRSRPVSGHVSTHHVPGWTVPRSKTASGQVVIAYRSTRFNPGRYLQTALERSGLLVDQRDRIDWTTISPTTRTVIVVESPLPALEVTGNNPGIPVIFWAHHGEHHIDTNVRLQRRYGADLVVLAHSWHLAHRFLGTVDRMPFGVPSELFATDFFNPHAERRWDVGFVGATSTDKRYAARDSVLAELTKRRGAKRITQESGISPERMAKIYLQSRVVIDDGASRHLPITMRVFEGMGAGAMLVTNEAPGMEVVFERGLQYLPAATEVADQVVDALDRGTEPIAMAGHRAAWQGHTYDIRVTEILALLDEVDPTEAPRVEPLAQGPAAAVSRFADAQRILDLGESLVGALPGREVWGYQRAADRAEPGTFHISVVSDGSSSDRARAVAAARIAVVCPTGVAAELEVLVGDIHGALKKYEIEGQTVFTFGSTGYRVDNRPDPA
jgi:hypothetical protein